MFSVAKDPVSDKLQHHNFVSVFFGVIFLHEHCLFRLRMFGTPSMERGSALTMDTLVPSGVWMLTVSFLKRSSLLEKKKLDEFLE